MSLSFCMQIIRPVVRLCERVCEIKLPKPYFIFKLVFWFYFGQNEYYILPNVSLKKDLG